MSQKHKLKKLHRRAVREVRQQQKYGQNNTISTGSNRMGAVGASPSNLGK